MSSSSPKSGGGNPYGRFIPREELQGFASWQPGSFGGTAAAGVSAAEAPEQQALLHAARQAGYQEGYRDGLVALENFKRSVLQQNAAQFGALLQQFDEQLDGLELDMARALTRVSHRDEPPLREAGGAGAPASAGARVAVTASGRAAAG